MELRETFDTAAALYHDARPGYPEALFDDLVALTGLTRGARVLEVGAGTGIATLPLARWGFRVLALEPGAALAAEARRRLAGYAGVEVHEQTLEAWQAEPTAFALALAATSWHWVEQPRGFEQLGRALAPDGAFAVFRHIHVATPSDGGFFMDQQRVYQEHAPSIWIDEPLPEADLVPDETPALLASGLFSAVEVRRYRWDETYDAERYLRILRTFSGHIALPAEARKALLAGVAGCIDERFGGSITKGYLVILHVARRR